MLFQPPFETEHYLNVSGTSEEWRKHIGRFCSGNSRLMLAVSCAFAGPVLSLLNGESGGVHLMGTTSTGKSTALLVGGSVLGGGGRNGFVVCWACSAVWRCKSSGQPDGGEGLVMMQGLPSRGGV
jgi:putative DNA primase/helicase